MVPRHVTFFFRSLPSWCSHLLQLPPILKVIALRTGYREIPPRPGRARARLRWVSESAQRGEKQTACEIRVTSIAQMLSRRKAGLWASGKVPSGQSVHVTYAGEPSKPVSKIFGQLDV
jgi:alpha-L-rhamnosidase